MRILAILVLILITAACDDAPTTKEIVPLAIGNHWTVRSHSPVDSNETFFTMQVIRDTMIAGLRWFWLGTPVGQRERGNLGRNESDGFHRFDPVQNRSLLIYKYPTSVGDTYLDATQTVQVRVISLSTVVTTPAGTFSCIQYQWSYPPELTNGIQTQVNTTFVCPGVGIVKGELAFYDSTMTHQGSIVDELESYLIK